MADLRRRTILNSASQEVPCLGKTEYGEKGQRNSHAVTWLLISCDAGRAAAQSNHQCQWDVQFHPTEQEKKGVAKAESKNSYSNQKDGATFRVIGKEQILCLHDQVKESFFHFLFSSTKLVL